VATLGADIQAVTRLEATKSFKRVTLLVAAVLAVAELGLFAAAWRLGVLLDPAGDARAAALFVAFGTVLTLQAMVVVGIGWLLVAMARTTLDYGDTGLSLEHPWRRWDGSWSDVKHAWYQRGWLTIQTMDSVRRWYVRVAPSDSGVAEFRRHLAGARWLEGRALTEHLARQLVPLVALAAVLGVATFWALRALG
jgi:hypothetical protein